MACLSRRVPDALAMRAIATTPREMLLAQTEVCDRFFMVTPTLLGIGRQDTARRIDRKASVAR
jgi:hypothetical protein